MNDFFGFDFVGILILLCILIYLLFDLNSDFTFSLILNPILGFSLILF
jgi:hypothetical protein